MGENTVVFPFISSILLQWKSGLIGRVASLGGFRLNWIVWGLVTEWWMYGIRPLLLQWRKMWSFKRGGLSWGGQFSNILLSQVYLKSGWIRGGGLCGSDLMRRGYIYYFYCNVHVITATFSTHSESKDIALYLQVKDEVAKLLDLKAQLGEDPGKNKFVLKCPKVMID